VGLEGDAAADQEVKRGSRLTQPAVPMDYTAAWATLTSHQNDVTDGRYHSDPQSRVHRVFTDSEHIHQRWQRDWTRDRCVTVAQLCTGHCWQHTYTVSDAGTLPRATALKRRRSTWSSSARHTTRLRGRHGLTKDYLRIHGACRAFWKRLGR